MSHDHPSAEPEPPEIESKRSECYNHAVRAFGTAFILQRRAARMRAVRRFITFLGILVPVLIGLIALRFATASPLWPWLVYAAAGAGSVLAVLNLWATVNKWEDLQHDYTAAAQKNYDLHARWDALAKSEREVLKAQYDALFAETSRQRDPDTKLLINLTSTEKARGMRAALYKYSRTCATCKKVPSSERWKSALFKSRCETCGEPQK